MVELWCQPSKSQSLFARRSKRFFDDLFEGLRTTTVYKPSGFQVISAYKKYTYPEIFFVEWPWIYTGRLVLEKNCFSMWASTLNMGLINKGWYGMFVSCGIWCLADVSSVRPSSEQAAPTKGKRSKRQLNTMTIYIPQAKNITYQPLLIKPIFCWRLVRLTWT